MGFHLLYDDLHVFPTTLLHHLLSLAQLSHSADSGLYTAAGVSHGYNSIDHGNINDEGDNQCPKHSEEAVRGNSGRWKSQGKQTYVDREKPG